MKMSLTYAQLVDKCRHYDTILITGPQRSGTTIMAVALSNDLKYRHIDEDHYGVRNYDRFNKKVFHGPANIVVQCPALSHLIVNMVLNNSRTRKILVVLMMRPINEIITSQKRIKWVGEVKERENYKLHFPGKYPHNLPIAQIKYHIWNKIQKPRLHPNNYVEFDYNQLKSSPYWIEPDKRKQFESKQIK
jgi:hypothetical protein